MSGGGVHPGLGSVSGSGFGGAGDSADRYQKMVSVMERFEEASMHVESEAINVEKCI